jgi:hypothetical protein
VSEDEPAIAADRLAAPERAEPGASFAGAEPAEGRVRSDCGLWDGRAADWRGGGDAAGWAAAGRAAADGAGVAGEDWLEVAAGAGGLEGGGAAAWVAGADWPTWTEGVGTSTCTDGVGCAEPRGRAPKRGRAGRVDSIAERRPCARRRHREGTVPDRQYDGSRCGVAYRSAERSALL